MRSRERVTFADCSWLCLLVLIGMSSQWFKAYLICLKFERCWVLWGSAKIDNDHSSSLAWQIVFCSGGISGSKASLLV